MQFLRFYNSITKNGSFVLHEALGIKLVKMLFVHELKAKKDNNLHLLYLLVQAILQERCDKHLDYSVMHGFIDSTVDADRLDYVQCVAQSAKHYSNRSAAQQSSVQPASSLGQKTSEKQPMKPDGLHWTNRYRVMLACRIIVNSMPVHPPPFHHH